MRFDNSFWTLYYKQGLSGGVPPGAARRVLLCARHHLGAEEGVAAQLLALALTSKDTPSMIAGMVSTTNTLQSPEMRLWRIENDIITKPRVHSRNAASAKRRARGATLDLTLRTL